MSEHPVITDAPGLVWRKRKDEWLATWQARTDVVEKGFRPQTMPVWRGTEPTAIDRQEIADQCQRLQSEMLLWNRSGLSSPSQFDGTLRHLAECYQKDPDSNFGKLRYKSREHYISLLRRIIEDHGSERVEVINGRLLKRWHQGWTERGIPAAHAYMGMLRTLFSFGFALLEDDECERLCALMHKLKFQMGKPRNEVLTAEQATAIRAKAHDMGLHSVALAQAFQFEGMLRQKDVIGEWVPLSEPGMSDVVTHKAKWIIGLRWEEIDGGLILRHRTSKRQKDITIDLKNAPMIMEEFERLDSEKNGRPTRGPIVISEYTGRPFVTANFRRVWRIVADSAEIPKAVKNMDSRAGAITEATEAGADLEHIKHAATHGDISMTQRYARGATEKIARVQQKRLEHRNKK